MKTKEPPYTERYVRWCGRTVNKIIIYLLPDSLIYVFTFSFKYPFPLNLETDQEQDGINDAFPYGSKWDKTQGVVNQQSGDQELADAQCVVA